MSFITSNNVSICKGNGFIYFIKPLTEYTHNTNTMISIVCTLNYKTNEISGSGMIKDIYTTQPFMINGIITRVQNTDNIKEVECKFKLITRYTKTDYNSVIRKNKMYMMSDITHGILDIECLM